MSRSPVGGPAPRVFEGVLARSDEQFENPYWILEKGREASTDEDWFGPFPAVDMRGKRVRITVEVLPEPPTEAFAAGVAATKEAIARRLDEDGLTCTADEVRALSVELPTDGRTSSEANYDPMTAPVPEGDMNGPHGEIPPSSEVGRR